MITQDQLLKFDKYLKAQKVTDTESLLLFANLLLSKISSFEEVDLYSKRLPAIAIEDYTDFYTVKNHLEFNTGSISLEIASTIHKLLYLYNQIKLEEEKKYGRNESNNSTD